MSSNKVDLLKFINLPTFNHLFFNGSPVHIPAAALGNNNEYSRITNYKQLYNNLEGKNGHGFFEMLPNTMNPSCDGNTEGTNNRKKLLDEIKGNNNNVLYARFYMDVEKNTIEEIVNWDQITDNLKSLYPDVFGYAIYAVSGYATEEAFKSMFDGFLDKFTRESYTYKNIGKTIEYYYCITDNLIAYIELRNSKNTAGHLISFHATCCNVVYSLTNETFDRHIAPKKNCYIGLDPDVFTKWRAFRSTTSIKYDKGADEDTVLKNTNKAVHLGKLIYIFRDIFKSDYHNYIGCLMKKYGYNESSACNVMAIDFTTNIFFPGIIAFKSSEDLIVHNLHEITSDKFTTKFSDKIPKSLYPDASKVSKDNTFRNINKDYLSLKVDTKKYNNNLVSQIRSGKSFKQIIDQYSIFACFNTDGSTEFVNDLFELSSNGIIYAPVDEFKNQLQIWYDSIGSHTSYKTFDKFYSKAFKRLDVDECPSMIEDSVSKKLRNAFHKALYPDSSYNDLIKTWNKFSKKLSTDKIWNNKHVAIAKKFIEQLMAHTMPASNNDDFIKKAYDDMFKIYVPSNKSVFDEESSNSEEYVYLKDASNDFMITHSTLVIKYIKSLITCIRDKYKISSIEAFENDLHEYLDNWDNQLRCNMFEKKYSNGYINKDMPKLYYKTIIDSAIYKVIGKNYKGNFMVQHIQISKSIFIEDGYTDYDFKNLPIYMDKDSLDINLHSEWIESMYDKYKSYIEDNDGKPNDDTEKSFLEFEYAKQHWLKYLRKTFTCDDDFNYYLSWYHYKLNNEVIDRNMLNYGDQDCLKSTLASMIIDAGFDFGTSKCIDFINIFDYSVMNHTATILEELEHINSMECSQLIQKLKVLFKSTFIWTQDKNVKRFRIDRRVDFDITTNDSSYIISKLFGNCDTPDAITKRICVIERKSLDKKIIYDKKEFPEVRKNPIWNLLMVAWIKYDFNTDELKNYKLFSLDEMISYKDNYNSVPLIKQVKDNQHTKLERYMFIENNSALGKLTNNGKVGNLALLVKDIARPSYKQYDLKLTGFKDLYTFMLKRYNIEIFNKPNSMGEFCKKFMDNYGINIKYIESSKIYRLDIDNLNKLVRTFCDYSYSMVVEASKSSSSIFKLPTTEQLEHGYHDKLCNENTEEYTLPIDESNITEPDSNSNKPDLNINDTLLAEALNSNNTVFEVDDAIKDNASSNIIVEQKNITKPVVTKNDDDSSSEGY